MQGKFDHSRNLTKLEKEVLRYITENPGRNTEDVCNEFERIWVPREDTASACGYLFSDYWVHRDPVTEALTAIEEVPA